MSVMRTYSLENRKGPVRRQEVVHHGALIPVICILEQGSSLGRLALDHLELEGFSVCKLSMGMGLIKKMEKLRPPVVMIEVATSRAKALELCRGIRKAQSLAKTAVILLARNTSEEERVLGLESGADDYITEAASGREVVARVRAVMRRSVRHELHPWLPQILPPFPHLSIGTPGPTITVGEIEIDPTAMTISVRGSQILTTNLEFRLLYYLVHNQKRVFSRDQLLDVVWGAQNNVEPRSVDACVRRLRRKIETNPLRPIYLRTVRGAGYSLQIASGEA
jgi:DNA-binding response OmpR family regulator